MRCALVATALLAAWVATSTAEEAAPTPRRLDDSSDDAEYRGIIRLLETPRYQEGFVAVAIIVGVTLIVNGEFVFKVLAVAACGVLGAILGVGEVATDLGTDLNIVIAYVVGIEIGFGCAYAAYKGLDGVMLASFALFGFFLAYEAKGLLESVSASVGFDDVMNFKWVPVFWYSFFTLAFMRAVAQRQHLRVLAFLTPFLGGALISSALSWIFAATSHGSTFVEKGPWIEFLALLVVPGSKDVGIYAHANVTWFNTPMTHGDLVPGLSQDRVLGLLIWFFLFVFGSIIQLGSLRMQADNKVGDLKMSLLA